MQNYKSGGGVGVQLVCVNLVHQELSGSGVVEMKATDRWVNEFRTTAEAKGEDSDPVKHIQAHQ